jgi:hypothetical protein
MTAYRQLVQIPVGNRRIIPAELVIPGTDLLDETEIAASREFDIPLLTVNKVIQNGKGIRR